MMKESKPRPMREEDATYVADVFESGPDTCTVVVKDFCDGVWQVYNCVETGNIVHFLYSLQHNELHRVPEDIIVKARRIQEEDNKNV